MREKHIPSKVYLTEDELPKQWYNIQADMKTLPAPPLHPVTKQPVGPADLGAIFPMDLILQEVSQERYIDIPQEIQEKYAMIRPSPLCRAYELEKALGTPARIFFKYEGNNPSGSHKLNTALPQVYYNKMAGMKRIATETGAGQWGTALSTACNFYDIDSTVYMVKVSAQQKPYRRIIMETFGSKVIESPSEYTEAGRKILAQDPSCTGSLGIAIGEAVEDAMMHSDTNYALGSVLNHVLLHQTIIGMEAKKQFEKIDLYPDVVIGCVGGGSNFAGIAFPFMQDKLTKGTKTRFVGVEPAACPTLTKGKLAYDFGDSAQMAPITMMYTLGNGFVPTSIHAGGLRYHGMAPLVSQLYKDGLMEAIAVTQNSIFEAAVLFAKLEAILPAPESAHAVRAAIDEALRCKETGERKTILFNLSGHGYFDMSAYDAYNKGKLEDVAYTDEMLKQGLSTLPTI